MLRNVNLNLNLNLNLQVPCWPALPYLTGALLAPANGPNAICKLGSGRAKQAPYRSVQRASPGITLHQ
jgi:hypothetical protein